MSSRCSPFSTCVRDAGDDEMRGLTLRYLILLIGCTLCLLAPLGGLGQKNSPISASWILGTPPSTDGEPGQWTVGDRIPLRLDLSYPAEAQLTLPQFPQTWGDLEIYSTGELETVSKEAGSVRAVVDLQIIAWAPGQWQTPLMTIQVTDSNQEIQIVDVSPITIEISSVLPDVGEGESLDKEDLKPQAELPLPPWWLWLLLALGAVVAIYFITRWLIARWRGRKRPVEDKQAVSVDLRPAHIIALEELQRIATMKLPQRGAYKAHYTLLTDCLKTYLTGRYAIPALDRTTTEIADMLLVCPIETKTRTRLLSLLIGADLVKFAKAVASISEAESALVEARHIVELTQPQPRTLPVEDAQSRASRTEVG